MHEKLNIFQGSEDNGNIIGSEDTTTGDFDQDTHKQKSVLTIDNLSIDDGDNYICKWERPGLPDVKNTISFNVRSKIRAFNG